MRFQKIETGRYAVTNNEGEYVGTVFRVSVPTRTNHGTHVTHGSVEMWEARVPGEGEIAQDGYGRQFRTRWAAAEHLAYSPRRAALNGEAN